ncbi:hypothetical protein HZ992_12275 [Rhizobacter sp. AJA081-3]|nr:hypothetical protein [Rhizobacter sp. AJA081-3]QTN25675.1 hypothetical protein HZ992_12275 [Rhizobacter sp. AJA081-3]
MDQLINAGVDRAVRGMEIRAYVVRGGQIRRSGTVDEVREEALEEECL